MSPIRKKTNAITRKGVNFLKDIIESDNSIFNEIHQENDIGIDATIELIINEKPTNVIIAVQIKSGKSYYQSDKMECSIPVDDHFDYWKNYPLPVYGIVFVPSLNCAFWCDIKKHLKIDSKISVIKFNANETNKINKNSYKNIFKPYLLKNIPNLSFNKALSLFKSKNYEEFILGMVVLFKKHANKNIVWDNFINYILDNESERIPYQLIHYLAHIPWHGDIWYKKESYTDNSKEYAKSLIKKFKSNTVLKLLSLIDDEMICRGSIGQDVEAIISIIPNISKILYELLINENIPDFIKNNAAIIFAYYNGKDSINIFNEIKMNDYTYIDMLVDVLTEYGAIPLYN